MSEVLYFSIFFVSCALSLILGIVLGIFLTWEYKLFNRQALKDWIEED